MVAVLRKRERECVCVVDRNKMVRSEEESAESEKKSARFASVICNFKCDFGECVTLRTTTWWCFVLCLLACLLACCSLSLTRLRHTLCCVGLGLGRGGSLWQTGLLLSNFSPIYCTVQCSSLRVIEAPQAGRQAGRQALGVSREPDWRRLGLPARTRRDAKRAEQGKGSGETEPRPCTLLRSKHPAASSQQPAASL